MHSRHNEGKSIITERIMTTLWLYNFAYDLHAKLCVPDVVKIIKYLD